MNYSKKIKLNLGSGPNGLNNWLNFDYGLLPLLSKLTPIRRLFIILKLLPSSYNLDWPKIELVDISKTLPLENFSVKHIYCSHVLEHFHRWQTLKILKESHRILVKGGTIRIIIPDIKKICQNYLKELSSGKKNLRPGQNFCHRWWGYEKDIPPRNIIEKLSRIFIRDHQWHYDWHEIKILLNEAGFIKVKQCQFRQGLTPDINLLDLKQYEDHSLYLEAVK